MKFLIKYATRGRPKLFLDTLNNIQSTISTNNYEVIVSYDWDDYTMSDEVIKLAYQYKNVRIFRGASKSKIDAINRDVEEANDWDCLINMSDDMKFIVNGWDVILAENIRSIWGNSTDFFAHFNDGYTEHKLCTLSIFGREYYERFYYIYPPCYKSIQCDGEAQFVAMMLERYHYFDKHIFEHQHPANVSALLKDGTYDRNDAMGEVDYATYEKRKQKLFYVNNPKFNPINTDGSWDGEKLGGSHLDSYSHVKRKGMVQQQDSVQPDKSRSAK